MIWSGGDPAWLGAVGRLEVPSQRYEDRQTRYYIEECSATLVKMPERRTTSVIVSAWHCLEGYRDLSRDIVFTLTGSGSQVGPLRARRVASGGSMDADWAILRLEKPLDLGILPALALQTAHDELASVVTMAGYSRDAGRGAGGELLTYDRHCAVRSSSAAAVETDCQAHKGASGGAVTQQSSSGEVLFAGVISEGNGEGISRYVPLSKFRSALELALH
ncbi:MAG: hypothetical protein Hals2KO_23720 [Halioglobus sp.]